MNKAYTEKGGQSRANSRAEPVRVSYSLVGRLSSRLFLRLFAIFLSLDIFICATACVTLTVYSERAAAAAAAQLAEGYAARDLPRPAGLSIAPARSGDQGWHLPQPLSFLLPGATAQSGRSLELAGAGRGDWWQRLESLRYNVFFTHDSAAYKISVQAGAFWPYFRSALLALLIYQFLTLLSKLPADRRLARQTLEPVSQLAAAAQSLHQAESGFDPEKMAALAGKLEGITAARLDTRIQTEETQAELKTLAVAINSMLDRIDQSYRAQMRFVSDASHELRTPIAVIQGYANLLDRWGKHDQQTLQESISAIKDEAANMKELVEQLLFLARGDNNTIRLQPEAVDLAQLAQEVAQEMRMIGAAHEFSLRTEQISAVADRSLLKQALRILVDNAVKYTDAGGSIAIAVERDREQARLTVTDEGIGISPEIVPHIFERFYRADESRARATGGAGLGLSIAHWIVTRHGGHMEVLSRANIGTRIVISLPAAPTAGADAGAGAAGGNAGLNADEQAASGALSADAADAGAGAEAGTASAAPEQA